MFNKLIPVSLIVLLSACGATQPPPYQKDRKPADREQYHGLEGMAQYQKDQNYLVSKELSDKCTTAKIDLAVAETDKSASEIKKQNALISSTCIYKVFKRKITVDHRFAIIANHYFSLVEH